MKSEYLIGMDVGGTFTDVLCLDLQTGRLNSAKVPSRPGAQWKEAIDSLKELEVSLSEVAGFVHGTTIATNALLEHKGAQTAFVTTLGFKDTIEIGKTRRLIGGLFDTRFQRAKPVVQRRFRYEASERIDGQGIPVEKLSFENLEDIANAIVTNGIEAVAIGFVNSYINDENEKRALAFLRSKLPANIFICASTEITKERGEFERFSTATLNAYLAPTVGRYLDSLRAELQRRTVSATVQIMGSNGGFMALNTARKFPVRTFLSGPVGGVIGAKKIASYSGIDNFITFDMGGTSTDVALVAGAMPKVSFSNQIGSYPTQAAQLDIQTIGAGGGSIASCDLDGGLDVGPQSAGAVPGPACYLRGGESATITDANVVLGRLPSKSELGGKLTLSREASLKAFGALANSSDETALAKLADGVIKIAVLKMAGAVREVSVHRGHDPREFYLLGFGGAGPMHVFLVAEELGVKNVLIPRFPGHLSALGQILADAQVHLVHAFAGGFGSIGNKQIQAAVQSLSDEAKTMLMADGLSLDNFSITAQVDVRYKGQSFTIPIPIAKPAEPEIDDVRQAFDKAHDATFGYCAPGQPIEVINVRLVGTVKSALPLIQFSAHEVRSAKEYYADVYWDGKWISTKVVQRDVLARNTRIDGPIIIAEQGSTTVVPPDWHLRVDNHGNLICHYEVHAR